MTRSSGCSATPRRPAKYINWIDFLFTHRPASWGADAIGTTATGVERAARVPVDPYALIKQEM